MTHYTDQREAEADRNKLIQGGYVPIETGRTPVPPTGGSGVIRPERMGAEADQRQNAEKVRYIADRIRAGDIGGLGDDLIKFVWQNRAKSELFTDCRLIIDTFPGQFPLTAERAAE